MTEAQTHPTTTPDRGENIRRWITTLTPLARIVATAVTTILTR